MSSTWTQIRRFVAPLLGAYEQGTATSGSTSGVLECTDWPFKSTLSQDDLYPDMFLFRPGQLAGDLLRVVKTYDPTTGMFTPDRTWALPPYVFGAGSAFEIHGVLPPVQNGQSDLLAVVNAGLKRCLLEAEITLAPASATATRHSLASAAPWLQAGWQVRRAGRLSSAETRATVNPYERAPVRGTVVPDGGTFYLDTYPETFATTDTLYLGVVKRAYDACTPSGGTVSTDGVSTSASATYTSATAAFTGADVGAAISGTNIPSGTYVLAVGSATSITLSANATASGTGLTFTITRFQSGLSAEADVAPVPLEYAGWAAVVEAWQRFPKQLEAGADQRTLRYRAEAAAQFTKQARLNFRLPPLALRPLDMMGPTR